MVIFDNFLFYTKNTRPIVCTIHAIIHAIKHCHTTTATAHFVPSSRWMEETAATHGVYSKLNTRILAAESGEIALATPSWNKISMVETTLSFAINPLNKEQQILQSPIPIGVKIGTNQPEIIARILSEESFTRFNRRSKL